jgi:hypothetical protein
MLTTIVDILSTLKSISNKFESKNFKLKPAHAVSNEDKVSKFANSIYKKGWHGPELIVGSRGHLLTGMHRYTAVKSLGWPDSRIPTITLLDMCVKCNINLNSLVNKTGSIKRSSPLFEEIKALLPPQVVKRFGL